MSAYTRIVVGTDGSDTSFLAVDRAAGIAADTSAEVLIVTAYVPATRKAVAEATDALKEEAYLVVGSAPAEATLRDAVKRAHSRGAEKVDKLAVEGGAIQVLNDAVGNFRADLVVVGNVGLNSLSGRILGSVPQSVARRSGVDVLIVHTSS